MAPWHTAMRLPKPTPRIRDPDRDHQHDQALRDTVKTDQRDLGVGEAMYPISAGLLRPLGRSTSASSRHEMSRARSAAIGGSGEAYRTRRAIHC